VTGDQIVDDLITLLRRHETVYRSASLYQEPYKGDFFKVFAAAFNAGLMKKNPEPRPYLSADALRHIIASRAPDVIDSQRFCTVRSFWMEWTYAWEHGDLLKKEASRLR
jgi:hypothetical protein